MGLDWVQAIRTRIGVDVCKFMMKGGQQSMIEVDVEINIFWNIIIIHRPPPSCTQPKTSIKNNKNTKSIKKSIKKTSTDPPKKMPDLKSNLTLQNDQQNSLNLTQSHQQCCVHTQAHDGEGQGKKYWQIRIEVIVVAVIVVVGLVVGIGYEEWRSRQQGLVMGELRGRLGMLGVVGEFGLKCLGEGEHAGQFQECQAEMKKKIKNPTMLKPPFVQQPTLTQIQISDYNRVVTLSSTFLTPVAFGARLFLNWKDLDPQLFEVEYYRLNIAHNLDQPVPEKHLCIMTPFRNLLKHGLEKSSVHMFLQSVDAQNYSSYHVYMIDDASDDGSTEAILRELPKYPRLNNRVTLLSNNESFGALANRDSVTRRYCKSGDIVMDIDGDDALIGKQAFNMFNRFYHNHPEAWFVYSNFVQIIGDDSGDGRNIQQIDISKAEKGPSTSIQQQIFTQSSYRTNLNFWATSQLRSYLYDLYIKIPISYLINNDTDQYYVQASDRFVMYALTQLAGSRHTFYLEQYPYFYYQPNYKTLQKYECSLKIVFYNQAKSRIQISLSPLQSLNAPISLVPDYYIRPQIHEYMKQRKQQLQNCQEKYQKNII